MDTYLFGDRSGRATVVDSAIAYAFTFAGRGLAFNRVPANLTHAVIVLGETPNSLAIVAVLRPCDRC